jgi:hypothetical protein
MSEHILFEMLKADTKKVVCGISEYKEQRYFFVREMWRRQDDDDDDWKFSKKVITFGYESAHTFLNHIQAIDRVAFAETIGGSRELGSGTRTERPEKKEEKGS